MLVLLFADRRGDLRVVLTLRSPLLRTFAGQVALPGGKADFLSETPVQTARREAYEEIGLPLDSHHFPPPFSVEHITELPCSLARTTLGVRPCVAFLRDDSNGSRVDVEEALTPRLDANEVSSVFSVPLEQFLNRKYLGLGVSSEESWYQGNWVNWEGARWRMHEFQAPVWERNTLKKYRVWGMTARILVDLARIAYGRDPEFEFNTEMGDESMIKELFEAGQMKEKAKKPDAELETKVFTEDIPKKGNL